MENKKRSTSHITRRFERTFLPHGGNPPQLDANQPIPAVDELNLDDRAKKYVKDGYSCLPKNCVLSHEDYLFNEEEAYKIGWNDSTHHNHASFVALVEGESNINIEDLHMLSDIYDWLQNRFKSLSEDTIERLSKPVRDLLLHNGVNVDDETEF